MPLAPVKSRARNYVSKVNYTTMTVRGRLKKSCLSLRKKSITFMILKRAVKRARGSRKRSRQTDCKCLEVVVFSFAYEYVDRMGNTNKSI